MARNPFLNTLQALGLYGNAAPAPTNIEGIPPEIMSMARNQALTGVGGQLLAAGFSRDPRARAQALAGISEAGDVSRPIYNMAQARLMSMPKERETRTATEEVNGRILLVDMETGETIRDLGAAPARKDGNGISINMGANEGEFQKVRAKALGDRLTLFEDGAIAAPEKIGRLQTLGEILSGVEQGMFAEQQGQVVSALTALGAPPAAIETLTGLDPSLPASQQAAKKIIAEMTMAQIGPGGFPAQNFSNADLQFLRDGQVSINALPEANSLRIKMGIIVEQAKMDANAAWENYRMQAAEAGMGENEAFQQFQRDYRKKLEADAASGKSYFADLQEEIDALKARGTPPAAPTSGNPANRRQSVIDMYVTPPGAAR